MSSLPRTCLRRDPPAFWRVRTTHAGLLPVPQWLQVIWEGQQEPVDHEDYQERLYEAGWGKPTKLQFIAFDRPPLAVKHEYNHVAMFFIEVAVPETHQQRLKDPIDL